jgi:TatD DNase family protein
MIDTHCHLYVAEILQDIEQIVDRGKRAGVAAFYLPAIDSSTHQDMIKLEERYPGMCYAMIGLHPCSVKHDYEKELLVVEQLLQQRKFVAIGETGLDFYWDKSFINEQYKALEQQIEWALCYDLPLVLHTRNATQETIDVIKKYKDSKLKGIFHCFGGSLQEANQIIESNFLLGIGGVVTYKNSGLAEVIRDIDLSSIVLETDAPYLAPAPYRGKRNESSYLPSIAKKIAEVKGVTIEEVDNITSANAKKMFATEAD